MKRPNILVFMTDQQHYQTIGPDGFCRTPHVDGLADRGVSFSHAFTPTPICTPARASCQTGLTPHQHLLVHNTHGNYHLQKELPEELPTLGALMSDAGYATAYVGKYHVGVKATPLQHGYQRFLLPMMGRRGAKQRLKGRISLDANDPRCLVSAVSDVDPAQTEPLVYAEATAALIGELAAGDEPFFIFSSSNYPHVPWVCPEYYARLYDPADIPRWPSYERDFADMPLSYSKHYNKLNECRLPGDWETMALALCRFFGMVTMLDDAFGIMLRALEEAGCLDNTAVIFTSDHGEMMGRQGLVGKGEKLLDDIIRVPLVIAAPGGLRGVSCDRFVSLTDLFATCLDLAGTGQMKVESRSLCPLLYEDRSGVDFPDEVFVEHNGSMFFNTVRGIRSRDWKYVFRAHEQDEFYDLRRDPWEMDNRIDDPGCASLIDKARRRLLDWMDRTDDQCAAGARRIFLEHRQGAVLLPD